MKVEYWDGTKETTVRENKESLMEAVDKAASDPRTKKITIKMIVPGRKRKAAKGEK